MRRSKFGGESSCVGRIKDLDGARIQGSNRMEKV